MSHTNSIALSNIFLFITVFTLTFSSSPLFTPLNSKLIVVINNSKTNQLKRSFFSRIPCVIHFIFHLYVFVCVCLCCYVPLQWSRSTRILRMSCRTGRVDRKPTIGRNTKRLPVWAQSHRQYCWWHPLATPRPPHHPLPPFTVPGDWHRFRQTSPSSERMPIFNVKRKLEVNDHPPLFQPLFAMMRSPWLSGRQPNTQILWHW